MLSNHLLKLSGLSAIALGVMYFCRKPKKTVANKQQIAGSKITNVLNYALLNSTIVIGDKLNLFEQLHECKTPVTSEEFAIKTNLDERWIREWLGHMAAGEIIEYTCSKQDNTVRFHISQEMVSLLCSYSTYGKESAIGILQVASRVGRRVDDIAECFKTGGGVSYDHDDVHHDIANGISRVHHKTFDKNLIQHMIPGFNEHAPDFKLAEKLTQGIKVADIGCGGAISTIIMAKAYPNSEFHGFELSSTALQLAKKNIKESGLTNVFIHDVAIEPLEHPNLSNTFDFAFCHDLIHDAAHPEKIIASVYEGLKKGGAWFVVDIDCGCNLKENLERGQAVRFGLSVLLCMPSGLAEKDGMGLGTVGLNQNVAAELFKNAGFKSSKYFCLAAMDGNSMYAVLK